ncbi:hypothetical protein [Streptomyces sp. NPDC003077]|uniref:hypothetical protein n=1 Tax=Streptomyces sp. NPDC003077 TaxID=3154443 RepID=UPI0033A34CCB
MAFLVVSNLGLVGCASEQGISTGPDGNAAPAPATAPSSPGHAAQREGVRGAVNAYRAMWKDMERAALTADPADPRLDEHATGAALRLLKYVLSEYRRQGVVAKGTSTLSPRMESVVPGSHPTRVTIRDCADASQWLLYKSDGGLKNNVPGGHHDNRATMQRFGNAWKAVELKVGKAGSC